MILLFMCGAPGSGKSTVAKSMVDENVIRVSRDEIRFALLGEKESYTQKEYFSKEGEVYKEYFRQIQAGLDSGKDVIVDATLLNVPARKKVLDNILIPSTYKIGALFMDTPLNVCLERNNKRIGKTRVPESALVNMYNSFVIPAVEEGFDVIASMRYKETPSLKLLEGEQNDLFNFWFTFIS